MGDTVVIAALAQGKRPGDRIVKSYEKWAVLSAYMRRENVPLLHEG